MLRSVFIKRKGIDFFNTRSSSGNYLF